MTGELLLGVEELAGGGSGWLLVRGGRIAGRGGGPPPREPDRMLAGVLPGFLDPHVHGALGVDLGTPGADPAPVIAHHAAAGSTRIVASLATAPVDELAARLRELAPLVAAGDLAGLHLEGPWLAPARRGAHAEDLLRAPVPADVDRLLAAGDGALVMVTLAPELPGGLAAVARLVAAGVTVAVGHTDAEADQVRRAVDAGASVVTHLFNGMPPLHHRRPGPVGVALTDDRLAVELIADGRHVAPAAVELARRAAPGRLALVSDAMAATGLGDGDYRVAGSAVQVRAGVATLAGGGSLAGSTTTVGGAVARLLREERWSAAEVAAATSAVPARMLGLDRPALAVGEPADLVEIVDGAPVRVMRRGSWLGSSC